MKIFVNSGDIATVAAPADIKSGDLFVAGALVGFAQADAAEGDLVAIVTEGVFQVEVASAEDIDVGDVIYLVDGELTATGDEDATRAGVAYGYGESDGLSAIVNVKINA